jgi:hypothetical protein
VCESYNGWTNYYTWNYKLWLDNDQGSYEYWLERAAELSVYDLATALKEELQEAAGERLPEASVLTDLLGYAIASINFYEIAEHMKEEID